MRIHVVSLPHTQTTREYDWCAYTAKVRKLGAMLHDHGHEMYLYAGTENETVCKEHIPVVAPDEIKAWWPGWNWKTAVWPDGWDPKMPWWTTMNDRAISEIRKRIEPGDAIGVIGGNCQLPISEAFPFNITLEWGIGYVGVLQKSVRAFESHAWMAYVYGTRGEDNGRPFDAVIPNSFVPSEYRTGEDEGYFLYLGRMIQRKGMAVVDHLAKNYKVITAGQGEPREKIEHRGVVLYEEKAELVAHATAVLVPTDYIEPFGGVAVEAMMSGVPVITTDWGAFPETVQQGVTGYRCHTLQEFVKAAEDVHDLDRTRIREIAI